MKHTCRWIASALTLGVAATLFPAVGAHASPEGRRNTALVATAAAGYFLYKYAQKPSTQRAIPAAAAAGAAGYAWYNDGNKRKAERAAQAARDRARWVAHGRRTANKSARVAGYRSAPRHRNHSPSYCKRHCRR